MQSVLIMQWYYACLCLMFLPPTLVCTPPSPPSDGAVTVVISSDAITVEEILAEPTLKAQAGGPMVVCTGKYSGLEAADLLLAMEEVPPPPHTHPLSPCKPSDPVSRSIRLAHNRRNATWRHTHLAPTKPNATAVCAGACRQTTTRRRDWPASETRPPCECAGRRRPCKSCNSDLPKRGTTRTRPGSGSSRQCVWSRRARRRTPNTVKR